MLTLGGVAVSSSIKIAGDAFDEEIWRQIRKNHGVVVSAAAAEEVKTQICHVYPRQEELSMLVKGRDAKSGTPRELTLTSGEFFPGMQRLANRIADEVLAVLDDSTTELVTDISTNGIILTGGGSQLWGMDHLLSERTGIVCTVAVSYTHLTLPTKA